MCWTWILSPARPPLALRFLWPPGSWPASQFLFKTTLLKQGLGIPCMNISSESTPVDHHVAFTLIWESATLVLRAVKSGGVFPTVPCVLGVCYRLNRVFQKFMWRANLQDLKSVTFIWKQDVGDVMKIRSCWVGSHSSRLLSLYKREIWTQMHAGECHVNLKAEIGWCICKARNAEDGDESPETRREARAWFLPGACRRNQSCQHLDFGLLASRVMRQ